MKSIFPRDHVLRLETNGWGPLDEAELKAAVETHREDGWTVANASFSHGLVAVELTRVPLPQPIAWVPLKYVLEVSEGAQAESGDHGVVIETPAQPWSYGVVLTVAEKGLAQVQLQIECAGAPCEVATLASPTEIFHAATIFPGAGVTTIALRTPPSLYRLVIRTGAMEGPARVTLLGVSGVFPRF